MRSLALWFLIGVCALAVLGWNGSRFVGTTIKPRSKDLTFLPTPLVARALCLGQATAVAKLRWIDSFSYFSLQLEHLQLGIRDDHVSGDGRGGMERLYETLIALDPNFLPFYEHAVLNTGGVLQDRRAALGFVQRGILEMPHESGLWRLAAAELAVSNHWSDLQPATLDAFLSAWADAELTPEGRKSVTDWRTHLLFRFRNAEDLKALPYWVAQLQSSQAGSQLGDYIETTIREQLASHAVKTVQSLLIQVAPPLLPQLQLDPAKVAARFPKGAPWFEPLRAGATGPELRPDPFGWPFTLGAGGVVSPGLEQQNFLVATMRHRYLIENEGTKRGRPPRDLAEATEWAGEKLADPPNGGQWTFDQIKPDVRWLTPPLKPWPLRGGR